MSLDSPRFTRINESFTCSKCGHAVPAASATCRDHCPRCLHSLHVDENPGDRASECGGLLVPVGYESRPGKGYMIVYRCEKCGMRRTTRFLEHDRIEADAFEALLKLTPKW